MLEIKSEKLEYILSNLIMSKIKDENGAPLSAEAHWFSAINELVKLCPDYNPSSALAKEVIEEVQEYNELLENGNLVISERIEENEIGN